MGFYFCQNILIILIISLAKSQGETITTTTDNDTHVSIQNDTQGSIHNSTSGTGNHSQVDRLFFEQEIPDEFRSTIPSIMKELDDMTDDEFLRFLKKTADRAKQSYEELTAIHDQLEKNLTSIRPSPPSQRLKRCHGCHKKRMGFLQPMPVFVPIAIPVKSYGGGCGGGCGGGGHGGGYYQQPQQVCHSCGGGGYGGGGGSSYSSASASASSSSGSWGKK